MLRTTRQNAFKMVLSFLWTMPVVVFVVAPCQAHPPNYETMPVHPRVEPIPPWLNNLPSYRERYNRPRYLGGKLMYHIEPSSQEAMSWHRSVHRGYYANHAPRMEDRYFYPKPWQVLTVGPRKPAAGSAAAEELAADARQSRIDSDTTEPIDPRTDDNDGEARSAPDTQELPQPNE
jgi:hypothetical protein